MKAIIALFVVCFASPAYADSINDLAGAGALRQQQQRFDLDQMRIQQDYLAGEVERQRTQSLQREYDNSMRLMYDQMREQDRRGGR